MNTEPDEFAPDARIAIVAEAVLLRAELAEARDERQANWERLGTMWQPTMEDIENADDLQSVAINSYTTARIENADDLEFLDEALALIDRAIDMLEDRSVRLTRVLAMCLEQIGDHLAEQGDFREVREPVAMLREIVELHAGR
jgi:hypothetical protein